MKISKILCFLLLLFSSVPVFAQLEGNPENFCRNGFFPRESENYMIGTVKGKQGERVYFYGDDEKDCPNSEKCRQKSYVIVDDELIVSRKFGNFACAWFQPKKGSETVGWISLDKIEFTAITKNISKQAWIGEWSFYDNEIKISPTGKPSVYKISGNAVWKGLGDNVHIGELDGNAKLVETNLKYGETDDDEFACKVTMKLVEKFLIVSDNLNCGGANVTFSGVYRK